MKRLFRKRKNPFEASLILDNPDIKLAEARYNGKPFFFARGVSTQRAVEVEGEAGLPVKVRAEYKSEKTLDWECFINPNALPVGFMPEGKLENWVMGTLNLISGIQTGSIRLEETDAETVETKTEDVLKFEMKYVSENEESD